MADKVIWLGASVAVYIVFCLYYTIHGVRRSKTTSDYFSAGPRLSGWPFAAFLSAASLSAWMFIQHTGLIYRDGLPYAYLSLAVITVPFAAILFYERLRSAAIQARANSLSELLEIYFQSKLIGPAMILAGLCFAIPVLAIQVRASGVLLNLLSDDVISIQHGMIASTTLIALYVGIGGMRAVTLAGMLQFVLLLTGIALISAVSLYYIGGFGPLVSGMEELAKLDQTTTTNGLSHYFAVPGIIEFVGSARAVQSSPWTAVMILTSLLAFSGILATPIFSSMAIGASEKPGLGRRQVWTSALFAGLFLVIFSVINGIGGHLLGGDMHMVDNSEDAVYNVMGANLGGMDLMETVGQQDELLPILISLTGDALPWLFGFLTVCALAAVQVTIGAVLFGTGKLVGENFSKGKLAGRATVLVFAVITVALSWGEEATIGQFGNLALAWGFQTWPALIALCFVPWFTAPGIVAGLLAGTVAAFCADTAGTGILGISTWGGSPLTLHPAFWGIVANLSVAILVSSMSQNPSALATRTEHHASRAGGDMDSETKSGLLLWAGAAAWLCLGAGPGTVISNTIFGTPADQASWVFGIPSIWAWQILWWALGVVLLWAFAWRFELASQASQI